jgi:thiol-disulfide isomerase/thioredoxin
MTPRNRSLWIVLMVPVLGIALGFLLRTAAMRTTSSTEVTEQPGGLPEAPLDFELPDLEGDLVRAQDLRGRVLLLDLWATWCGPCRTQAGILAPLAAEYAESVVFLGVNVGEDERTVSEHLDGEPLAYRVVLDRADALGSVLDVHALPTVVLVDTEGRVRFLRQGITGEPQLRRELAKLGATPAAATST